MLQAWSEVLKVERNLNVLGDWINEEPLFHNLLIQTRFVSSLSIRRTLVKNGVTKLGRLLDNGGWSSEDTFKALSGLCSTRIALKLGDEICCFAKQLQKPCCWGKCATAERRFSQS